MASSHISIEDILETGQSVLIWLKSIKISITTSIAITALLYLIKEYYQFYKRRRQRLINVRQFRKDPNFIYNDECPICFNDFSRPTVRAPCGHAYCMNCLLSYFTTNRLEWKCVCPLCRTLVNELNVLEDFGNPLNYNEEESCKTKALLLKIIKQQNKDIFLSRPWPLLKGAICILPIMMLVALLHYCVYDDLFPSETSIDGPFIKFV